MSFEVDHFFICTDIGAPMSDALVSFGWVEGPPNTHPGQGTANRRFFFDNAMLELLWVHDEVEAGSEPARRAHLLERWQGRAAGASPFGVIFRSVEAAPQALPFPGWAYRPAYLPEDRSMHIGHNSDDITEPLCVYIGEGQRQEPSPQPEGFRIVTALRIFSPRAHQSESLKAAENTGAVRFLKGEDHLMEIGFKNERSGRVHDFRPGLPVRICW